MLWKICSLLLATASLVSGVAVPSPKAHGPVKVKQLFNFDRTAWLENLAVRSDGTILATMLSNSTVWSFAPPAFDAPVQIASFPNATGVTGITEVTPDVFAVTAGAFNLQTLVTGNWSVWTLDFNNASATKPVTRHVGPLPGIGLANGLAALDNRTVLTADSKSGAVYSFDLATGTLRSKPVSNDTLMALSPGALEGINGMKLSSDKRTLFFTNSGTGVVGLQPLAANGSAAASAVALTSTYFPGAGMPDFNDDIALGPDGAVFVAGGVGNDVWRVGMDGGRARVLAGSLNSSSITEPTSVAFGRRSGDKGTLYVTTGGGLGGPINGTTVVGAQLIALEGVEM